jgi:ribosomal protein S18 acetylase RimI-like enzyme
MLDLCKLHARSLTIIEIRYTQTMGGIIGPGNRDMAQWITIRRYQAKDRQDVLRISADTAVFGEPVEAILEDRRLFCDAFTAYYTDFESDFLWVASVDEQVVGYLTGCVDTIAQRRRIIWRTILPLVGRLILGKYRLGRKTFDYTRHMAAGALRGEYPHVNQQAYPAHLHINVDVSMRGRGLGRQLMCAYLDQLREAGVPGVHLETTDINEAACRLYESLGFKVLDKRQTRVWQDLIDGQVENRIYGLRLVEEA